MSCFVFKRNFLIFDSGIISGLFKSEDINKTKARAQNAHSAKGFLLCSLFNLIKLLFKEEKIDSRYLL